MSIIEKIIFITSQQKALVFLVENAGKEFQEKEIVKKTGVKKSAVNLALRKLSENKIIKCKKIGRTSLYQADSKNNLIREIKVLLNVSKLEPLINKLKNDSIEIILFGSFANGTNKKDSDIDLFVLTNNINGVRKMINNSEFAERAQIIVKSPSEMIKINKNKPLLFQEIEKGKVMHEKNED
ncbi:MAG: nucleotidyltransferase domain-containing protein [bacterium]|nr:nucleotidyltransferase domain-containing protein [bacterium]